MKLGNLRALSSGNNISDSRKECGAIDTNDSRTDRFVFDNNALPDILNLLYPANYNMADGTTTKTGKITTTRESGDTAYLSSLKEFMKRYRVSETTDISKISSTRPEIEPNNYHDYQRSELRNICNRMEKIADTPNYQTGADEKRWIGLFASHLKNSELRYVSSVDKLIKFLDRIFIFPTNTATRLMSSSDALPTINPVLLKDISTIDELMVEVQTEILKMNMTCDADYVHGLKLYETIIERRIFDIEVANRTR
jgi:hypothetical protein